MRNDGNFLARIRSLGAKEQLIILAGSLLLAILVLVVIPAGVPSSSGSRPAGTLETHDRLAAAPDDLAVADTTAENQAAARRFGSSSANGGIPARLTTSKTQQGIALLRFVLILTILGIGIRMALLAISELKHNDVQQA
jgi:hypothetical protein